MPRYLQHKIPSDDSDLKKLIEKSMQQLINSLELILLNYPPRDSYDAHECHGLYSGPTSIAYLWLQLSKSHPDLQIKGFSAERWAKEYLRGTRTFSPVTASKNGVISEMLAFHAVHGITHQRDSFALDQLWGAIKSIVDTTEAEGSNEWLYGRVGCLYLLRLVRAWRPSVTKHIDTLIAQVVETVLDHGPTWKWHGKEYLGAVHGRIGIIAQIILSDPTKASDRLIMHTLRETLDLQTEDGNWPSSIHSSHNDLVQFCHGAPGFIISLRAIEPYQASNLVLQQRITAAMQEAQKCVLEKGLLTKQPNLCHGATGNALALPSPYREYFMKYATAEAIDKGLREGVYIPGDDPYGLFCGEAGRAWGWLALVSEEERGMIGFSDV